MSPAVRRPVRPHGTIRQSQVITTFGPGAMVDLPDHSIVVAGLDYWKGYDKQPVFEDRLVAKVEQQLDVRNLKLYAPPAEADDPQAAAAGITGFLFPEWFVAQYTEVRRKPFRARPLVHREALVGDKYAGPDRKKHDVVPVRFVQGCPRGHLSDIDWIGFVHEWATPRCERPLWIEERGTSGDLVDVWILCECGKARSMVHATRQGEATLRYCRGQRPWLGREASERCQEDGVPDSKGMLNRLLLRSASHAYFPQVLRVISIPDRDAALRQAVDKLWDNYLSLVEDASELPKERRRPDVRAALAGFNDEQVWAEIVRRRSAGVAPAAGKPIKQSEIETLLSSDEEIGEDVPEGADFYARRAPLPPGGPLGRAERLVLVHRLREVAALVGFTRFESQVPDIDGELSLDVQRADLARETTWLPAIENRGEGFFVAFKPEEIRNWLARPGVKARAKQLEKGIADWARRHPGATPLPLAPEYVMLHSLSHLLITAVSLECGYAASSIRERIYAGESGYGILLYTGTPDAEGTLGGLVQVGRRLGAHLETALDLGRLCSNDPVCAQHRPDHAQEERFLHGAACHGCLLIAEPSCERRNEYLDRALVVPTVDDGDAAFFSDGEE